MAETKYFLGFPASQELEASTQKLLTMRANGSSENYGPQLEKVVSHFVPELLNAFLVEPADSMGLQGMAAKVVHSTADVISKSVNMLVPKLIRKRNNAELNPMIDMIEEMYVREDECSRGETFVGMPMDKARYERFTHVIAEIRAGNGAQVQGDVHDMMSMIVDMQVNGIMQRSVDALKPGFVVKKLADGAVATCRSAGHGVVNKVFKQLDEKQLGHVANRIDSQLVYSPADKQSVGTVGAQADVAAAPERQPVL